MTDADLKSAPISAARLRDDIEALAALPADERRNGLRDLLKAYLAERRDAARDDLQAGASGLATAGALATAMDEVLAIIADYAGRHIYKLVNPTSAERLAIVAVGGYGRGYLAPGSDVDVLFLLPYKQTPWGESIVEWILYLLWDLGLKVGHSTRSVEECRRQAAADHTIRTALLEARLLWGDQKLYDQLRQAFWADVAAMPVRAYIDAKLSERNLRHQRTGESRYLVEPNVKDGKGGLRDLQSLFWIGKYVYRVESPEELVTKGLLTAAEFKSFREAEDFLWKVRCLLHFLSGRAEERLSFDLQPELAKLLGYTARGGLSAVERFMKRYFLAAKDVGDLTRIVCAALEDREQKPAPGLGGRLLHLFTARGKSKRISDFVVERGRIDVANEKVFSTDPVNLLRLFQLADEHALDIHPRALQLVRRNLNLVNGDLRKNPEANATFMAILASKHDPETALRRMNEAGVFGRFILDFGRIVALMQFNMYHHYTVDEHLIRAIGWLAKIERGELKDDHPVAHDVIHKILSREVLYLAMLLHDIAKGRMGDHSDEGAEIAYKLGPRMGLTPAETDTVAWLVQNHLVMSDYGQKRDLSDPKTVEDFAALVQSPERLRLLLVLTVADIRAVGPGVWNGWKGQLLRTLYLETEQVLSGGHVQATRRERVLAAKDQLARRLSDWSEAAIAKEQARHYDAYWLSLDPETHERHARMIRESEADKSPLTLRWQIDEFRAVTEVTLYTADHPGLFARVAGALALTGANIVDAKIFTTAEGRALDTFSVQDAAGGPFQGKDRLARLSANIAQALWGGIKISDTLAERLRRPKREDAFKVGPQVLFDNQASRSYTVIELVGRDRPGLLHALTQALFSLSLTIGSARIATYGERAVDVFYVTDLMGQKVTHAGKLKAIETRLLDALKDPAETAKEKTKAKKAGKPKADAA